MTARPRSHRLDRRIVGLITSLPHLVRRFFEVVFARRLRSAELAWVAARLEPELWALFIDQQTADQRHGLKAGRRITDRVDEPDLVVAAILHDVGKRHSRLGALGRSWATVMVAIKGPLTERMKAYRDHGKLGAADLEGVGAPDIAIAFARYHQYGRPDRIAEETWDLLRSADLGR